MTPHYYPEIGGVQRHVQSISSRLARNGHHVTIATMRPAQPSPTTEILDGVNIVRFPSFGLGSAYRWPLGMARFLRRTRDEFDIVHVHNYHASLLPVASAARPKTLIVTPHLNDRAHSHLAQVVHLPYRHVGRWCFRNACWVVCVSQAERARVEQRFGIPARKLAVIPNGVDVERFGSRASGAARDKRLLLVVGRLQSYKRVDRVIDVVAALPHDYRLVVVGDGPERAALVERARARDVADRVQFTGSISDQELEQWYGVAQVLVNLSESEAFGLTIVEALAAGCQVVCSPIPAFRDIAARFPTAVTPVVEGDLGSLAAVVEAACQRDVPSVRLDEFSWDGVVMQLERIYDASRADVVS